MFKRCQFWDRDSCAEFTFKCVVNFEHRPSGTRELTANRNKPGLYICAGEKVQWLRTKEGYHVSKIGSASICLELRILASE
jgi:hypothetical protein